MAPQLTARAWRTRTGAAAYHLLAFAGMKLASYDTPFQVETIWRRLEAVARPPYTLSWGWIETWLATREPRPALAVVHDDAGEPIAAAFEELPVLRAPAFPALGVTTEAFRIAVEREVVTPHVDLDTVRSVAGGYLATRPAATRAHLRHARRQSGELAVDTAHDVPQVHALFDELLELAGAADHATLRRLLDRRAPHGEIELVRIRAGAETLGCFYNVVWLGHVAYQLSAFATCADVDLCHAAAIEHAAACGHAFYDLHPEHARLATGETRQLVLRLERRAPLPSRLAG